MFDLDCIVGFTLMFTFILMLLECFSLLCYYFVLFGFRGLGVYGFAGFTCRLEFSDACFVEVIDYCLIPVLLRFSYYFAAYSGCYLVLVAGTSGLGLDCVVFSFSRSYLRG